MNLDIVYAECKRFGLAGERKAWLESVSRGIIDLRTVLQQIHMTKEQKVLEIHRTAITELDNGRWQTTVKDDSKSSGRREIKLSTYEKVIERLYDFYFSSQNIDNLNLCTIFEEWLEYKCRKNKNKEETKKQNRASFKKYVANTTIAKKNLKSITTIDLEDWAIDVLSTYNMTAKTFNTHKIAIIGPLAYAKRKKYITENPWKADELEYKQLFKSKRKKPSELMVFYPDEIELLVTEFERGYALNGNLANLALTLNFELGLRIGELAALKWSDINWRNCTIFIQRQEDSTKKVVEYVKSDSETGYRELALSTYAIEIFKRIKSNSNILSGFIFCDGYGTRLTKLQISNRLRRAEKAVGFEVEKESHCIRRTVASRMNINRIPLEEIRRWLGHTNLNTTMSYLFNPFREDETMQLIKTCSILSTNKECLQVSTKKCVKSESKKRLNA